MFPRTPVLFLLAMLLFAWASVADASTTLDVETMKSALKTDTEEEDGFLAKTLNLMNKGVLPRKMVYSTFLWAKKKRTRRFQYFKWGMIKRAAEIGVEL